MTLTKIEQEIVSYVHDMAPAQQDEVLTFVRSLAMRPVGVRGHELLEFAGAIAPEDLAALQEAIEAECEQVDLDEW